MAIVATNFNWVKASSGVWTRIWQGPLIQALPMQTLEFSTISGAAATIRWTLDGYSAAPPFYQRDTGSDRVLGSIGNPPVGSMFGFFSSKFFWYGASPWVEFKILTDTTVWVHMVVY